MAPWGPKGHAQRLEDWDATCGAPCCVMRQRPALLPILASWPFDALPRFLSSFEEFDAYVLPWVVGQTFKAVMVRRPYERWLSEAMFECRLGRSDGVPSVNASLARPRARPSRALHCDFNASC